MKKYNFERFMFRFWNPILKEFTLDYTISYSGNLWEDDNFRGGFIQQYTGLEDINGIKVFEGDIVYIGIPSMDDDPKVIKNKMKCLHVVEWDDVSFMFCARSIPYTEKESIYTTLLSECVQPSTRYIEVVGNVFKTKKYLKGQFKERYAI